MGDTPDAEVVQPDKVAVGQPARRWDKKGVEVASRDDCADATVPTQVVQEPMVGDTPDAEGVPAGVQVQPEATQGMTWAQVVRGHVVGNGRDGDPVRARVVQVPVAGDVPDAERVQPEEVAVEQPADQMVPEPVGAQVQPEVNPVRGTRPDTRT